jgi:hypothetical protein
MLAMNARRAEQKAATDVVEDGSEETLGQNLPQGPVGAEASLFQDMQHVRRHPKEMDRRQGQRDARKWKEKDLTGFMRKFADLEKAALTTAGKEHGVAESDGSTAEPETPDAGTDRVLALIREFKSQRAMDGQRVADAWDRLSEESKRTILAVVDAAESRHD